MSEKNELKNLLTDENKLRTRKEFLKNMALACAATTIPLVFLEGCSDLPEFKENAGSTFEITFSRPMDTASVEQAVSISPVDPGFLAGSPVWSEGDTVVLYRCEETVTGSYTLTIGATAMDKTGQFLDGNGDGTGGDDYADLIEFS